MILIIPLCDKEVGFLLLPSLISTLHMLSLLWAGHRAKAGGSAGNETDGNNPYPYGTYILLGESDGTCTMGKGNNTV